MVPPDQLLDGMVDLIVGEIHATVTGSDWKSDVRRRILSARLALVRHLWASRVIESRAAPTPVMLGYMDSVIGLFRTGGFSADLTHHVMHALGSRLWGFTQELFDNSPSVDSQDQAVMLREMAGKCPYVTEMAIAATHDESVVGSGCDDQFEFEFALDLLLDGFEGSSNEGGHRATALVPLPAADGRSDRCSGPTVTSAVWPGRHQRRTSSGGQWVGVSRGATGCVGRCSRVAMNGKMAMDRTPAPTSAAAFSGSIRPEDKPISDNATSSGSAVAVRNIISIRSRSERVFR